MELSELIYLFQACIKFGNVNMVFLLFFLLLTELYLFILFVRELVHRYKKVLTDCSLQVRINKDLEGSTKKRFCKRIKFLLDQLYLPNKFSITILILVTIVMYVLGHLKIPNAILIDNPFFRVILEQNDFQNFVAIVAGIGTIIFALIIFIAESLRDDSERARVLLKESLLYPLTFFGITELLIFLWLDVTYLSVISIFLLAGFAIFSISRMIRVLLNRSLFLKKEHALFRDRVKQSIDKALRLRVGNNIYLKKLEEDQFNIDFSMFDEDKEGYSLISLSEVGVITDINLCALDKLFDKLEELANIKNLSLKIKESGRSVDGSSLRVDSNFSETETKLQTPIKGYILKKLGDELSGERQHALVIPKPLLELSNAEKEVTRLTRAVFVVADKPEESLSEQLRSELNSKKDTAIDALRNGKVGTLEEIADLYVSVVVSFLETIKEVGGGFSQKDARKERGSIIGGWDEVRWVSKDLYWLLEEAVKTENSEAISTLSHVPIAICIRAIHFSDHFVFQEFVQFQTALYRLSKNVKSSSIKNFLIDRSWRYLKEMADFYIGAELESNKPSIELENFRDFGVDIMLIFQALLKNSFARNDPKSYELFAEATNKLFEHFNPSEKHPSVRTLELFLKNDKLESDKKVEYALKLSKQIVLEGMEEDIDSRKKELFFGISGWILNKHIETDFNDDYLQKFWTITKRYLPKELKDLLEVYQRTHGFDTEDFWGWDWWEMEGQPEGVANSIDINGKFDWTFCVRSLELISGLSREQILATKIDPKRDLVYLIEKEDSAVKSRLNQILQNKDKWIKLIPENSFDKIVDLKDLLNTVVSDVEYKEQDILINSRLDDTKIDDFYRDFRVAFFKSSGIRTVFRLRKKYIELKRNNNRKISQWGFNQIADKEAFVKDWHVGYPDWGKHYGEELGSAEDQRIFGEISKQLTTFNPNEVDINEKLVKAITALKRKGYRPSIILTTAYPSNFDRGERGNGEFVPHYQTDNKFNGVDGFIGVFKYYKKEIPVFEVRAKTKEQTEEICVIDLDKFGKLIQHQPYLKITDKKFKKDIFIFRIIDLNEDTNLNQSILNKKPDWLMKRERPGEYLKQKVVTNILERLELRVVDKRAGLKLVLPEESLY